MQSPTLPQLFSPKQIATLQKKYSLHLTSENLIEFDNMTGQREEKASISRPKKNEASVLSNLNVTSSKAALLHNGDEPNSYYFHADHLGSTSAITDANGSLSQHVLYFAYGQTFIEEHRNSINSPYLYNGKEYDQETGRYYYGARYYDPRVSLWIGVDPLAEKYAGISPYAYCANNPILFLDLDGREIWISSVSGENIQYTRGMKYKGSDNFIKTSIHTLNKLQRGGRDKFGIVNYYSKSNQDNITINESNALIAFAVDATGAEISSSIPWNPTVGARNKEGFAKWNLSPAGCLLHELGEIYYSLMDPEGKLKEKRSFVKSFDITDWGNFDEAKQAFNIVMGEYDRKEKQEVGDYDSYSDKWIIRNVEKAFNRISRGTNRERHNGGEHYTVKGGTFSIRKEGNFE